MKSVVLKSFYGASLLTYLLLEEDYPASIALNPDPAEERRNWKEGGQSH